MLRGLNAARNSKAPGFRAVPPVSKSVRACCIQCGIALTEQELDYLAGSNAPEASAVSGRLQRIQKGYCARRTCDSYFYELTLIGDDKADLEPLWNMAAPVSDDELGHSSATGSFSLWHTLGARYSAREVLTAACLLATLWLLLWWQLRTPSWATRPSGYQVDVSAIEYSLQP